MWECVLSRFSCVRLIATLWTVACQAPLSMGSSRQEYWNGYSIPVLLQGIVPTRGSNPHLLCLLHWQEVSLPIAPSGLFVKILCSCSVMSDLCNPMDYSSPGSSVHGILQTRKLEWAAISFSRVSSQFGDWTRVSYIVGRFFTVWATKMTRRRPETANKNSKMLMIISMKKPCIS